MPDINGSAEMRFGAAVRTAREEANLSQEALARQLADIGIPVGGQSGMARIERGERPTRLNQVVEIAYFLSIDLGEVCHFEPTTQMVRPGNADRTVDLLGEIRDLLTELVAPVRARGEVTE